MAHQQQGRAHPEPPVLSVLSTGIFVGDEGGVTCAGIEFASVEDAMLYLQQLAGRQTAITSLLEVDAAIERMLGIREQLRADIAARAAGMAELRDRVPGRTARGRTSHDDEWDDAVAVLAVAASRSEQSVSRELTAAASRAVELPASLKAWGDGTITGAHLRTIERASNSVAPDQRPAFDAEVVTQAKGRTPAQLAPLARRVAKDFTEHPLVERHASAFAERGVWVVPEDDGMATLSILTSSVLAEGIQNRLRLAFKHKPADDERTIAQFASDTAAAVLLAGEIPDGDGTCSWLSNITAHVTITMPATTLTGTEPGGAELPNGQLVDDDTALMLAGGVTSFTRLFTHPVSKVAVASDSYQPTMGLRRFIIGRDRCCRFPGCTRPAIHADLDHTQAWEHGGSTRIDNLAALCRKHHLRKHRLGAEHSWRVHQVSPGVLEWTDPTGRTVQTCPEPVPTAVGGVTDAHGTATGSDPPDDGWQAMLDWHEGSTESDSDPPPF